VRTARAVAVEALGRIESDGAYANLVLGPLLDSSGLSARDRHFATELVYGTTRMRRACDFLVDRFVVRELDPAVRRVLRLGAYQLHHLGTPAHAAVGETVEVAPKRARGLVNAVLRRVADADVHWPDDATRLSYPDWIVDQLTTDLGTDEAIAALEAMDVAPSVTERADGYVQDVGSQWVAELVDPRAGDKVADLCAAPGGKATLMTGTGAHVIAADVSASRLGLVRTNVATLGVRLPLLATDGRAPALRPRSLDRVLVDAPCSGLGTLRRRPDARWRIQPDAVDRLAAIQRDLVDAAAELLAPGGVLVYSACTLTAAESLGIDEHLARDRPDLVPLDPPSAPWQPHGRGARLLPQAAGTDGMVLLRLRRS
jgi:16S rRNA (cytosine967-C5)-methyltransferase